MVDSFDEIDRLERLAAGRDQHVLLRVTPGIEPDTHAAIRTGQMDSKFGIPMEKVHEAVERCAQAGLVLRGLHAHIGSQVFELDVYESLAEVLLGIGDLPLVNLGGGFGIAYTREDRPPSADEYAEAMLRGVPDDVVVLCEPGRSLVGNAGVTLYTVGTVKEIPGVRTYVAVDGGMSDNIRPMLYGVRVRGRPRGAVRRLDAVSHRGHALRVRRRAGAGGGARASASWRHPRDPRHRRLWSRDGQQLQRGAAAPGDLLPRRRRARCRAARDLRRPGAP